MRAEQLFVLDEQDFVARQLARLLALVRIPRAVEHVDHPVDVREAMTFGFEGRRGRHLGFEEPIGCGRVVHRYARVVRAGGIGAGGI